MSAMLTWIIFLRLHQNLTYEILGLTKAESLAYLLKRRDSRLEYSLPLLKDKRLVSVEQDVRDYRLRLNRNIETLTLYKTQVLKCKYSIWLPI